MTLFSFFMKDLGHPDENTEIFLDGREPLKKIMRGKTCLGFERNYESSASRRWRRGSETREVLKT